MRILVLGNENSFLKLSELSTAIDWLKADDFTSFDNDENADAYFNLMDNAGRKSYSNDSKPIFINSVTHKLQDYNQKQNIIRFNGWNGFIKKDTWELSGKINAAAETVLQKLNKKQAVLSDEPGFISPRVISMIVNEAYFAKQEKVSSEEEIDIAMKLGTNYPKGPFEWGREIGIKNIYELLKILSVSDKRYQPAALLELEALKK